MKSDENLPQPTTIRIGSFSVTLSALIIYIIIAFLAAKFLGLTKIYLHIDPYGLENLDFVSGALIAAIGVLYKEIHYIRKDLNSQVQRLSDSMQQHGERLATLEAKAVH